MFFFITINKIKKKGGQDLSVFWLECPTLLIQEDVHKRKAVQWHPPPQKNVTKLNTDCAGNNWDWRVGHPNRSSSRPWKTETSCGKGLQKMSFSKLGYTTPVPIRIIIYGVIMKAQALMLQFDFIQPFLVLSWTLDRLFRSMIWFNLIKNSGHLRCCHDSLNTYSTIWFDPVKRRKTEQAAHSLIRFIHMHLFPTSIWNNTT